MIIIFILISLPILSSCWHSNFSAQFYSKDRSIQYLTNTFTHSTLFTKGRCKNEPAYPYMIVDSRKTNFLGIIVCNIHARELIVTEICLKWLDSLSLHPQITDKMSFKVFYRANRMRDEARTEEGQCKRTNQNNVDLNRNFPTEFNYYKVDSKSEIYPSDRPINQPFTICLNQTIEAKKPDFFLDIHSGESAFYYQEGINNGNEIEILQKLNSSFPDLNVSKITTLAKDEESINGHIFADLKVRKNVSYSFLFEVFDGTKQNNVTDDSQCFKQFNPITPGHMVRVQNVWTDAINSAITQVITFLNLSNKTKN